MILSGLCVLGLMPRRCWIGRKLGTLILRVGISLMFLEFGRVKGLVWVGFRVGLGVVGPGWQVVKYTILSF